MLLGGFVIQIPGSIIEPTPAVGREKVSVTPPCLRVGDGSWVFCVGFLKNGATEYLMVPKNGEPELKPGTYQIPNRHNIGSISLSKEDDQWFMERLQSKQP